MSGDRPSIDKPRSCPEPGLIAAHAERRLAGDEAARLDEHLAGCADCCEVFAETLRFGLAEGDETRAARPRAAIAALSTLARRPAVQWAAGSALAAALLLALFLPGQPGRSGAAKPLVAALAEAVGERRFIEPRLTGGFEHGRLTALRSGDTPRGLDAHAPDVLAAVARIRTRAESDPSPVTLGAVGVTYLVSGDVGAAVRALESATAQEPENPSLLSDLAAAYLARAAQADEPADIPKALEAAEKAIALPDPPDEAWFNRALALEALHLVDAARQAWQDYLQRDPGSGWAEEAREHLERLPRARESSIEEDKARVRAALEEGVAAVERLAHEDPQLLRDYLDDDVLPAWADAYLVGHPDADLNRAHARVLGAALLRTSQDAMPRDVAQALSEPPADSRARDPLRSQALGYRAFREAKRRYVGQEPSCSGFRESRRYLDEGDSPFAAWARLYAVIACHDTPDAEKATREVAELAAFAEARQYVELLGRIHWNQGLTQGMAGELSASLERYRLARAQFQTSRNVANESVILALLAESFQLLGDSRSAWRHRLQAFALLAQGRESRFRPSMLSEAIYSCLDERMPRSALRFGTALVAAVMRGSSAVSVSEALQRRAAIHHELGDDERAAADLREARTWIARVPDKSWAERIQAEADATEGQVLARRRPEEAAGVLARCLAYFRATAPVRTPVLHLALARAQAARGLHDDAEAELLAGIRATERQRSHVADGALQVSFFDQAFPLFEEMVQLQVVTRGDPERALDFVERSLARQLADALGGAHVEPLTAETLRRGLPEGLALVYYVPLEHSLYAWALSRDGFRFIERSLPAAELSRLVAAHRTAIERRAAPEVLQRTAAQLHDELVRPFFPFLSLQQALVFIPGGVLQSTAFACLWDRQTGRYLVEDHVLGVAPSGTVFLSASSRAVRVTAPSALVVGNPRVDPRVWAGLPNLPEAEAEAAEVAGLYPASELLVGHRATKPAFVAGSRRHQVVHYAGHAATSISAPSSARLLLASAGIGDSGALYLHELQASRLHRTRVVVLAACRTASGPVSRVEGALSLGRPFLAAGAPDVVASLWDIEDAVSRRFFVAFHRHLLAEGDPVIALRQVQLQLVRSGDASMAHPANWAAFICMGGLDPHSLSKGEAS